MYFTHRTIQWLRFCDSACSFVELPHAPKNLRMIPDLSRFSMTLEWDSFKVPPDDIIVEMKAEDESNFTQVAKLKGKITELLIENIDKTKRYTFRAVSYTHLTLPTKRIV